MNKQEFIERYGIEKYKRHVKLSSEIHKRKYDNDASFREHAIKTASERCMRRYNSDSEYRERKKKQNLENCNKRYKTDVNYKLRRNVLKYVREGELERIENYELALADNFEGWVVHHRLELTINGEYAHSEDELRLLGMYLNRPYYELIFMRKSEHRSMHAKLENKNRQLKRN